MGNHANNLDMFEGLTQYIWAYPQFIGDSIIPGQIPEEFYFLGKTLRYHSYGHSF